MNLCAGCFPVCICMNMYIYAYEFIRCSAEIFNFPYLSSHYSDAHSLYFQHVFYSRTLLNT